MFPERRPRAPRSSRDSLLFRSFRLAQLLLHFIKAPSLPQRRVLRPLFLPFQALEYSGWTDIDVPAVGGILYRPRYRARRGVVLTRGGTWQGLVLTNQRAQRRVCLFLLSFEVGILRRWSQLLIRAGSRRLGCFLRDTPTRSRCLRRGLAGKVARSRTRRRLRFSDTPTERPWDRNLRDEGRSSPDDTILFWGKGVKGEGKRWAGTG